MRSEIVPRQRHWMESSVTPVPLTRHQTMASLYQGCSQKALAPLATVSLPLTRQGAAAGRTICSHGPGCRSSWHRQKCLCHLDPAKYRRRVINKTSCNVAQTLLSVLLSISPYTPSPLRRNTADCSTDLRRRTTAPPTAGRRFRRPAHREPTPARGIQAPWRARTPRRDPSP